MKDENEDKDLCKINVFGSGIQASFHVHKNIPFKIGKELGEENRNVTVFLDRGEELGECQMFGRNSLIVKKILNENEFEHKKETEDLEMEYYGMLEEEYDTKKINDLQAKIEDLKKKRGKK